MQKIKEFWINSYTTDKTAFAFELISFIFTVAASLTLAVNARDPNMKPGLDAKWKVFAVPVLLSRVHITRPRYLRHEK